MIQQREGERAINRIINVPEVREIIPHCETTLPNHECPYIGRGCTGCLIGPPIIYSWAGAICDSMQQNFNTMAKIMDGERGLTIGNPGGERS